MVSRRELLRIAALGGAAFPLGCAVVARRRAAGRKSRKLRTITYNVLECQGWSPGKGAKPAREEIHRMFAEALGRLRPDIVTFQESPPEEVVAEIARLLGMNHTFFPSGKAWPGALMTRFEIIESQNCPAVGGKRPRGLFTRHWGRAVLRAPFGDLVVHSAHLHPSNAQTRLREVEEILRAMESDFQRGRLLIFQGDLNHPPTDPEHGRLKQAGLVDAFEAAGVGPGETFKADHPAKRIDYIFAYGTMARHIREARVLRERPFCTDPDNPRSVALSDHLPVMAKFA